jgi:hypothetical protein
VEGPASLHDVPYRKRVREIGEGRFESSRIRAVD